MSDTDLPHKVSDKVSTFDLTGYLCPVTLDYRPSLLCIINSENLYISVFSTEDKFYQFILEYPLTYDKLVQISDSAEFIDSIPQFFEDKRLLIIIDPHKHENGKCRYNQIERSS